MGIDWIWRANILWNRILMFQMRMVIC